MKRFGRKFAWYISDGIDKDLVRRISNEHNLTRPIAEVLVNRGLTTSTAIRTFLFPSFDLFAYSPSLLKDAENAAVRIIDALKKKEKVLVFGDYDVDGITSTSLFLVALLPLGLNLNFYLPNREREGYGLSAGIVQRAAQNGYSLLITVDNGITSFDAAEKARELGIDLIITDHHRPKEKLPPAWAIVDPQRFDCPYPYKELAGVGIAFKLISLIYHLLGQRNLPLKVYELLMLGSVADVVPLTGENRFWVKYGLTLVNKHRSLAINHLLDNMGWNKSSLSSLDVGYGLAPQINALGRIDDPRSAVKFLISSDREEVKAVAKILKERNEKRKEIDKKIYFEIEKKIKEKVIDLDNDYIIVASSSSWPSGVIGLVAGKLARNYGRPVFLFHETEDGLLKGSCRSIPEFNVFDALVHLKNILYSFGGHSFAAGLRLKKEKLSEFKEKMEDLLLLRVEKKELVPKIKIDAILELPDIKKQLLLDLKRMEPFGNKNEQPLFWVKQVSLVRDPILLKESHVKCWIFSDGIIKPVIFFNRPDLYSILQQRKDDSFDLAAYVVENEWQNRNSIELQGIDISHE